MTTTTASLPPCKTLYVRNVTEKLPQTKLQRQLFNLFSNFGRPVDVVLRKGQKMRGQAWVVFEDVETATRAKLGLNNYAFFDKSLTVEFAKLTPEVLKHLQESFVPGKQKRSEEAGEGAESDRKRAKLDGEESTPAAAAKTSNPEEATPTAAAAAAESAPPVSHGSDSNNPPHRILKADSLPEALITDVLREPFARCAGFQDLRHIAVKGVAFAEFDTIANATLALGALRGYEFHVPGQTAPVRLRLNYSKQ